MAGTAFSYTFPADTFADAEDDMLTYTATKPDDTGLPTWLRFSAATRTFSGTPPAAETVSVKVTASDGTASATDEFDIMVAADTTPPTLTSATVPGSGGSIALAFSEDLQSANLPPAAAFTVTVGGTAVTVTGVAAGTHRPDALQISVSTLIGQGQAVVVAYADPTGGDDAKAIQDTVGNDTPGFTTGSGDVPAVTNNSARPNEVLASWSLTPAGLAAGDQFRLLFLSSTKRDAVSTDIADYNTFVQDRTAAGHADIRAYSAGFRAVGCTGAVDARDNTSTTGMGVPIYWLDGTKVADDYADFYDGDWDDEVNDKNESGTDAHDTSQSRQLHLHRLRRGRHRGVRGRHKPARARRDQRVCAHRPAQLLRHRPSGPHRRQRYRANHRHPPHVRALGGLRGGECAVTDERRCQ